MAIKRLYTRLVLLVIILILTVNSLAQSPNWEWARSANSGGRELAYDICVDPVTNDVYIAGEWSSDLSASFPAGTNPSTDFSSTYGGDDGFIAKYDKNGNFFWAFKLGGTGNDIISAITVDPSGNIYITGTFDKGTGYFSGTSAVTGASTLTNTDKTDFFIAKYDSAGTFQWVRRSDSDNNDFAGHDVSANSTSVFASGHNGGTGTFGPLPISLTFGNKDIFMVKYDGNGTEQWLILGGSNDEDFAHAVSAVETDVFLAGNFKGTQMEFTNTTGTTVSTILNVNSGKEDVYLASYDVNGSFNWSQAISSNEKDECHGITLDSDSLYLTGAVNTLASFPIFAGNPLTSSDKLDVFISSHSKLNGNTGWAYTIPCTDGGDEYGLSITRNNANDLFITGFFKKDISFPDATILSSAGSEDVFVAAYSAEGSFKWAKNAGSNGLDIGYGVTAGSGGSIFIAGEYDHLMNLDLLTLPEDGNKNVFLAKLLEPCSDAVGGTASASHTEFCNGDSATLSLTGYSGDIRWQKSPTGLDTWANIPGEITNSIVVIPISDTDYRAFLTSGACNPDSSNVLSINVIDVPTADPGPGGETCGNMVGLQAIPSVGTGIWSKIAGAGTALFTPSVNDPIVTVTVSLFGTYEFKWTETNGICSDDSIVIVTFTDPPVSDAGSDAEVCVSVGSFSISGSTSANGTIAWTSTSDGSFDAPDNDNPTYTIGSETDSVILIKTVTSPGSCADAVDSMVLTLTPVPASDAGPDAEICASTGSFSLSGSTSANGTIAWSTSGDGGFDAPGTDNPTYSIGTEADSIFLVKTVTSPGSCADAVDSMVLIFTLEPVSDAGPDAEICTGDGSFIITGSSSSNGSILWTSSGDGTFDAPDNDNPTYTIGSETDSVILIKTVTSPGSCADAVDSMILTLTPTPDAITGPGGQTCELEFKLDATPGGGSGVWTKTSGPGSVIFDPSQSIPGATAIVSEFGLYVFTWTVYNGVCSDTSSVNVSFLEMIDVNAGAGGSVCGLAFNLYAVQGIGSGIWTKVSGPGSVTFNPSDTLFNATATVDQFGTYEFQWNESQGNCNGADTVAVSFFKQPNADAGPDQELEFVFSTLLEANIPEFGTGRWTLLRGDGQFEDENDPGSEVTELSLGENEFSWTILTGVCEEVSDNVIITVRDILAPTVITPNNDGFNDFLSFPGIDLQTGSELIIYNRWGTEVYRNGDYQNDWSGKDYKGRDLISDTYYYVLILPSSRIIKSFVEIRR